MYRASPVVPRFSNFMAAPSSSPVRQPGLDAQRASRRRPPVFISGLGLLIIIDMLSYGAPTTWMDDDPTSTGDQWMYVPASVKED